MSQTVRPPYFCGKCGKSENLALSGQKFYYRTILGWIGLIFGLTYQFIWKVEMYFCADCRKALDRYALVSRWSIFLGLIGVLVFMYLAISSFPKFEPALLFFGLSFVSIGLGFLGRAIFQNLGTPKVRKISRRILIVEIPSYGNYDFTKGLEIEP